MVIMLVVVVKVPETITEVTHVCMIEYGVDATVEVTGTALGTAIGVKDEVTLVATGVAGL